MDVGGFGPLRYCHDLDYLLKAIFAGHQVKFVEQTLCEYRVHGRNTIDQDMNKVQFEEAWIIATFLRQNFARISELEMAIAAERTLNKGLATRVLGILRSLTRDHIEYDYRTTYSAPCYTTIAGDISYYGIQEIAGPRQVVHEIDKLLSNEKR